MPVYAVESQTFSHHIVTAERFSERHSVSELRLDFEVLDSSKESMFREVSWDTGISPPFGHGHFLIRLHGFSLPPFWKITIQLD